MVGWVDFIWLASIKLYPVFLLLYPLLTRQWKVLASAVLCAGGIAWLSLHVFVQTKIFLCEKHFAGVAVRACVRRLDNHFFAYNGKFRGF
ncbi:MAG: DUF2029 domain-containing protein [Cellvibrionales bacterium]|nr:DUF2029 domain-containing protein [Cellvibrionales bacterium]